MDAPGTDSIYFSGSGPAGRLVWNEADGTLDLGLKGNNVTLQIGQKQVTRVVNKTGINLTEAGYQVVRITGAQGNRLKVGLALADSDANSTDTIGLVTENIPVNEEGFITTSGLVQGIDTRGTLQGETWNDGDVLYLSPITSGSLTNIKPQAPQHTVIMGFVVRAQQNQGSIYVKVDNGYELDELHNVRINTGSLSYGDLLMRSSSVWVNTKQLSGSYAITGSLEASSFTGSLLGTSSWATNALTASFAPNYVLTSATASMLSPYVLSSQTSSFVQNSQTSSFTTTSSFNSFTASINSFTSSYNTGSFTGSFTGSLFGTSSWATNALTASLAPNYLLVASTSSMLSPYVLNSQTSSMSVLSSSYAVTASFVAGIYAFNYTASFTNQSTWTVNHNLGTRTVMIQAFDNNFQQIVPQNITLTDSNTATITFPTAETGFAVASVGGAYNVATASVANLALTASFVNPLRQTLTLTGSLNQSGSLTVTNPAAPAITISGIISSSGTAAAIVASGYNTKGGNAYFDFLSVTNTTSSATNPNKWFRLDNTGNFQIISSNYATASLSISDAGDMSINGSLTMANRPAFRVYGAGTVNNLSTTTNGDGTLNSNNFATDYSQGSGFNASTGIFTAPIAGLYSVHIIARNDGNANYSQLIAYKNNSVVIACIEFAGNSTMNHTGASSIAKLAVGDTLRIKVAANTITFDGNDSWAVAYIG